MKHRLIALLKTLFASKGFSAKALEGLADHLAANLTDESTDAELASAIEGIKPMTDIMQSEINRQINEAKKPKVEEPAKPVEEPAKPAAPSEDVPEWAKGLVTSISTLTQGLASIQAEKVGTTRREQYAKTLEGTSEAYKAKALKDFDRLTFKDDEDFNSWVTENSEDVKVFVQEETNNNLGGDRPTGGYGGKPVNGEKEVSPAMKELIAEREAKAKPTA
ncbi:MAG: hypothetical protein EOO20_06565 [Chryseobacterium sp.]|nr:MAG: hypothetical protein EOO20_06565 [Chryseobacterium sp.]